jgi:general secretion pathway protein L
MANHVLGVDLGAYSVKVAVGAPGFRQAAIVDFVERPVPPAAPGDPEPHEVRALRVLAEIIRDRKLEHDAAYVAVSGDEIFVHVLELPFKNLRRQELEKAIGNELEGILPIDLEEMVYAFGELPDVSVTAAPVEPELGAAEDEPTKVQPAPAPILAAGRAAAPTEGMRVLTCTMRQTRAREIIERFSDVGVEARGLLAAPGPYGHLAERIPALAEARARGPVAIIDIGHLRTDVVVVRGGRGIYHRTIARGGQHVTATIAKAWRLGPADAETAKHTDGFVASRSEPAQSEAWQRVHEVVVAELGPLARDLRQTFATCRAKTGATVTAVLLVGGGSRLRGLPSFLAEQLGVAIVTPGPDDVAALLGPKLEAVPLDVAALSVGAVFDGGAGKPSFDLRSGDLAYKADLSFLRAKAPQLAAAALAIVAFAALSGYAALYKLRKAETVLQTRLAIESNELFGESLSAKEALARAGGGGTAAASPLPKMTAYDVLLEVSSRLPDKKTVTVDVTNIDIRDNRIQIDASAKSTDEIDKIVDALKAEKCFEEVNRGNTSAGPDGSKTFSLNIKAACM